MAPLKDSSDFSSLSELAKHHIDDSFDYFIDRGLDLWVSFIKPLEIRDSTTVTKLRIWLENPSLSPPDAEGLDRGEHSVLYPSECRQAGLSYRGRLNADLCFQYNDGAVIRENFYFGRIPIMLKSRLCHLRGDPERLVELKEEENGWTMSVIRNAYLKRGPALTDKAIVVRCLRPDQSSVTVRLYYLQHGSASLGFTIAKEEFIIPVGILLKALIDTTDSEIYMRLVSPVNETCQVSMRSTGSQLVGERARILLNEVKEFSLYTRLQCLQFIGEHFQAKMTGLEMESYAVVGEAVIKDFVFVHLDSNHDKFNLLLFMLQKLFALVDQTASADNPDSLQNQEVLLPGHFIALYLKEKLVEWLAKIRRHIYDELKNQKKAFDLRNCMDIYKQICFICPLFCLLIMSLEFLKLM